MKLFEILDSVWPISKGKHVLTPWSDFKGKAVKLPGIYDPKNRDIGRLSKVSAQTVVVTNTKTKQILGRRTVFLKDPKSLKVPLPYDDPKYSSR